MTTHTTVTLTRQEADLLDTALDALIAVSSDQMIDGHTNTRLETEVNSAQALRTKIRDSKPRSQKDHA
jgi:hypothetical protein